MPAKAKPCSLNPCCNGICSRRRVFQTHGEHSGSLNPCCNGICSRRISWDTMAHPYRVLILVVMEYALGGATRIDNAVIKTVS